MHIVAPVVPVVALIVAPSTMHIVAPVAPTVALVLAPIVAPVVPTVALSVTVGRSEHRLQQGEDTSLSLLR